MNILYKELKDMITDRLDNIISSTGFSSEPVREKLTGEQNLAKAATQALLEFVRVSNPAMVPDLVQTVSLQPASSYNGITAYTWPLQAMSEREDTGLLRMVLNGEEVDSASMISYDEVLYRATSALGGSKRVFNADFNARRIYAPTGVEAHAVIVRQPDSIRSADQGEYKGVRLRVVHSPTVNGPLMISDGQQTLSVEVLAADSSPLLYGKITDAINAEEDFFYDAVLDSDQLILKHRYDMPLNTPLQPAVESIPDGGEIAFDDIGTVEIPVSLTWIEEMADLSIDHLMKTAASTPQARRQTQTQQSE